MSAAAGGENAKKSDTGSDDKNVKQDKEKSVLSMPQFSLSSQNPNNVISGMSKGMSTAAAGSVAATALVIGGPVLGAVVGYNKYGAIGGGIGFLVGTAGGVIGGAVVGVACVFTGFWQMAVGAIRTPSAIAGTAAGKDWDNAAQEWVHSDLAEDARRTLCMSDDDFMAALKESGSAAAVLSGQVSTTSDSTARIGRKNVLDRELYDVLGVQPEATVTEIKKAYYIKARLNHPDRNPNDPTAHQKFQKIGEAYQVLSDERLRMAYDTKGKEAIDSSPKMDASAMYAMIFGSENFEHLIGELELSTQIKAMVDGSNPPADLLAFKQRKREIQCAVNLATKLGSYVDGNDAEFIEKARSEAKELSESPMGGALLDLIGQVYQDQARCELSFLDSLLVHAKQNANSFLEFWGTIVTGVKAAVTAIELSTLQARAEAKQKAEDDKNGVSDEMREERKKAQGPLGAALGPGEASSPEEKAAFRSATQNVTAHVFLLMWSVTKADIHQTLANVCTRVMHDHSLSEDSRHKRAKALLLLGEEYCKCGVPADKGIEDFLAKLGTQTGMYGQSAQSTSTPSSSESEEHNPSFPTEASVLACFAELNNMSIKEMKLRIAQLNGSLSPLDIEKNDVRRKLKSLLCRQLSVEALRKYVTDQVGSDLDVSQCDRDFLVEMVLQL